MQECSVGRQTDGNEINESLVGESSEKGPLNVQQQSNETEVNLQTWNRRNENCVAADCNEEEIQAAYKIIMWMEQIH